MGHLRLVGKLRSVVGRLVTMSSRARSSAVGDGQTESGSMSPVVTGDAVLQEACADADVASRLKARHAWGFRACSVRLPSCQGFLGLFGSLLQ